MLAPVSGTGRAGQARAVVGGVLVAVAVVVLACAAGGALMRALGQPAVVGEIGVGILLGPSALGRAWPEGQAWLLPGDVLPRLGTLGDLGLILFMFLVGLELELGLLRGLGRTVLVVSQAGVWLPLACGGLLALGMYGTFAPEGVGRAEFVLFVAVALSVTAFPVLARILTEEGLHGSPVGALALACAAVVDVVAWSLLAVAVAVAGGGGALGGAGRAALAAVFVAVMWWGVRPLLARAARRRPPGRDDRAPGPVLVGLFGGTCLAAWATDGLGVHALFGAFVFGAVVPRGVEAVERAGERMREFAVPVLLPLFFVGSGLRTDVGTLSGSGWLWAGAILVVAVASKGGGATVGALLSGRDRREAVLLGALMNCRGVTELVVLNVGLGLGLIGVELFTALVLMALVTTGVTGPVVRVLRRRGEARPGATMGAEDLGRR
ncbi:cation:proton antiporter [Streptomyces sp. NPDC087917]|uniref:cation:proton antiporter domain-containing protein n=1 Tax=Streptomyces sp. NPDC087917 TaxID=3155060 RepID=UPI0034225132